MTCINVHDESRVGFVISGSRVARTDGAENHFLGREGSPCGSCTIFSSHNEVDSTHDLGLPSEGWPKSLAS